ncbi:GTPase-activating protein GYP8 [Spathaspora sp. JA1]|nr:GTPase-activating protein GYP8 [Spathaspora sp. JA1]
MDSDTLSKSLYKNEELPLNDNIRGMKAKAIREAIGNSNKEEMLELLCEFSRSTDGLITNELRSKVWPVLLGIEVKSEHAGGLFSNGSPILEEFNCIDLPSHKDEEQVKLDIQRSFSILKQIQSLPNFTNDNSYTTIFSSSDVQNLKKYLSNLIIKLLRKYPRLNYYQGYHDIASVILLVCYIPGEEEDGEEDEQREGRKDHDYNINEELAFKILERITVFHLRDYMIHDIALSIDHLRLIPALLETIDVELFELIKQTSNSYIQSDGLYYDYKFYSGLSSILTMFSHDLSSLSQILTVWDFSLSYNSVLINMYLYTSALLVFKHKIFKQCNVGKQEREELYFEDIDSDLVHNAISANNLFDNLSDVDLIKIMNKTRSIVQEYPIDNLTSFSSWFRDYNKSSVLVNTSDLYTSKRDKFTKYADLIIETIGETPIELNKLLELQDDEISRQIADDLAFQRKILLQQEELNNSILTDTSAGQSDSFTSDITSVNTSLSIHRIASSILFKKFFHIEEEEGQGKKIVKRRKEWWVTKNIFKISFTIGFVGIVVHFLLKNNPQYQNLIARLFNDNAIPQLRKMSPLVILNYEPITSISNELSAVSEEIFTDVGNVFNDLFCFIKDSEVVNSGISIGQVGLGNLKSTIYGFTA